MRHQPLDRRSFLEAEYKRELVLHHVEIPAGQTASLVYSRQGEEVTEKPLSGVFRDFAEYGVHPARVAVQQFRITIPFLLSALSAHDLADEITNQKQRPPAKKKGEEEEESFSEREEAESRDTIITSRGYARTPASVDAAFELIKVIQKRKIPILWTTPLQRYMSALNLFLYHHEGTGDNILRQWWIPPRMRAIADLSRIIPNKIFADELFKQSQKDPTNWGTYVEDPPNPLQIANLISTLMTTGKAYTTNMSQIINWYKRAWRLSQITALAENTLNFQHEIVANLRVRSSLRTLSER